MFISQRFYENGKLFLPIFMVKILSRNNSFFLNKNSKVFETENRKFWAKQNHALFLIEDKF